MLHWGLCLDTLGLGSIFFAAAECLWTPWGGRGTSLLQRVCLLYQLRRYAGIYSVSLSSWADLFCDRRCVHPVQYGFPGTQPGTVFGAL